MITGAKWFTSRTCIGIVQVVEEHQREQYRQTGDADYKYYIGTGQGRDEYSDRQMIAYHGMPFDVAAGDVLFNVDHPLRETWK